MLLFMGLALEKSGAAREMLLCLRLLLGRIPAGLTIAVTLLGILLAPAAGLIGASVATLALVALPTMLEQGYKPSFATGSVAAAGTLGIILPPGIMLFFLAQLLGVPMGSLFLATIVPGLTLAGLFVVYYALRGAFDPELAPPARDAEKMKMGRLFLYVGRSLALPVLFVAAVLGSIIAGWATPTQSGAVGAAGGVMLLVLNRRFTLRRLNEIVIGTTLTTSMVFLIVIAATVFSYPFRYLSGDEMVVDLMLATGTGDWGVLALILTIIFVLGFFIDWIEITVITLADFLSASRWHGFLGLRRIAANGSGVDRGFDRTGPSDLLRDAALRFRAVLRQGGAAAKCHIGRRLPGNYPVGHHPTRDAGPGRRPADSRHGPAFAGLRVGISRRASGPRWDYRL